LGLPKPATSFTASKSFRQFLSRKGFWAAAWGLTPGGPPAPDLPRPGHSWGASPIHQRRALGGGPGQRFIPAPLPDRRQVRHLRPKPSCQRLGVGKNGVGHQNGGAPKRRSILREAGQRHDDQPSGNWTEWAADWRTREIPKPFRPPATFTKPQGGPLRQSTMGARLESP
jgi:hypothetical protein